MMKPNEQEVIKELNFLLHTLQVQTDIQSQLSMQEHLDIIIQLLSECIRRWLDHYVEHLLRLLYLVDVRETHFHNALASDESAIQLAQLILHVSYKKPKLVFCTKK